MCASMTTSQCILYGKRGLAKEIFTILWWTMVAEGRGGAVCARTVHERRNNLVNAFSWRIGELANGLYNG